MNDKYIITNYTDNKSIETRPQKSLSLDRRTILEYILKK